MQISEITREVVQNGDNPVCFALANHFVIGSPQESAFAVITGLQILPNNDIRQGVHFFSLNSSIKLAEIEFGGLSTLEGSCEFDEGFVRMGTVGSRSVYPVVEGLTILLTTSTFAYDLKRMPGEVPDPKDKIFPAVASMAQVPNDCSARDNFNGLIGKQSVYIPLKRKGVGLVR